VIGDGQGDDRRTRRRCALAADAEGVRVHGWGQLDGGAEDGDFEKGDRLVVTEIRGHRLKVRKAKPEGA
jgi:hypothetical protein